MTILKKIDTLSSTCGRQIAVWELGGKLNDTLISGWARHFRQAYCADAEIDLLRVDLSRKDYLTTMVFPHATEKPGPSIRSGDFAELLIADFLEYVEGFWVPRYKYADKASPNESVKGSDVLGFRQENAGVASHKDMLVVCEVKAQLTGKTYKDRLRTAVVDSSKDIGHLRLATSLNALKRRAALGDIKEKVELITRFQKKTDAQFILKSSAASVLSDHVYDVADVADVDCSDHVNFNNLDLIVVKGEQLMTLVHKLYEVSANEA